MSTKQHVKYKCNLVWKVIKHVIIMKIDTSLKKFENFIWINIFVTAVSPYIYILHITYKVVLLVLSFSVSQYFVDLKWKEAFNL